MKHKFTFILRAFIFLLTPAFAFSQTITLKQIWLKKVSVLTMKFTPDASKLVTGAFVVIIMLIAR